MSKDPGYSNSKVDRQSSQNRALKKKIKELEAQLKAPPEFDEEAFRREWYIRGIGMAMPRDAMHGARCYHHWFVKAGSKS